MRRSSSFTSMVLPVLRSCVCQDTHLSSFHYEATATAFDVGSDLLVHQRRIHKKRKGCEPNQAQEERPRGLLVGRCPVALVPPDPRCNVTFTQRQFARRTNMAHVTARTSVARVPLPTHWKGRSTGRSPVWMHREPTFAKGSPADRQGHDDDDDDDDVLKRFPTGTLIQTVDRSRACWGQWKLKSH